MNWCQVGTCSKLTPAHAPAIILRWWARPFEPFREAGAIHVYSDVRPLLIRRVVDYLDMG
jgi:hypothetical protein